MSDCNPNECKVAEGISNNLREALFSVSVIYRTAYKNEGKPDPHFCGHMIIDLTKKFFDNLSLEGLERLAENENLLNKLQHILETTFALGFIVAHGPTVSVIESKPESKENLN